jgi:hypothetical protein
MTLILSVAHKDDFVFITSDSRVVKNSYDLKSKKPIGESKRTDITQEKTIVLTDHVLLSTGGNGLLGKIIDAEMKERTKPEDDLAACTEVLKDLIQELRGKKEKRGFWGLLYSPSLCLDFLNVDDTFGCCMVGFYKEGGTGMTTFGSGENTFPVERVSPNDSHSSFMFAPTNDYQEMGRGMFTGLDSINSFLDSAVLLHASISYVQSDAVSEDCNIYILIKEKEKTTPHFLNHVVNTEAFHKRFPPVEEVEKKLNLSKG